MNRNIFKIFFATVLLVLGASDVMSAYDFSIADRNGNNYYFNVIDSQNHYVELTFKGKAASPEIYAYVGEVTIPSKVRHDGTVYVVKAIGAKAFAGAKELTDVIIPFGLTYIGDFAFDNCPKLSSVVFPGNQVELGEGVFFRCPVLKNVTLGSDWKSIDFEIFKWSRELTEITIPAKMTKVSNLKSLSYLEKIVVDVNNPNFASHSGLLYNKQKTVLYACPLAYLGCLSICPGTEEIFNGALNDCTRLTHVIFPESIKSVSYQVLARAKSLETVEFRSHSIVNTAEVNGEKYFVLVTPNAATVRIDVPSALKKEYKLAMKYPDYNFSELGKNSAKKVYKEQLVLAKNVKGTKNR